MTPDAAGHPEQAWQLWQAWLGAVARAAAAVERTALAGPAGHAGAPEPGDEVVPPPMPAAPFPAGLEPRRSAVLDQLARALGAAERRRDELGAELARLGPAAARPVRSYSDGATLDIVG